MRPVWASPILNLVAGVAFVAAVTGVAVLGYMANGWSAGDALYMAVITVFTVGYGEVRPIDTPGLRAITIGLVTLGCTGMIFVTGALVQVFTFNQLAQFLGHRRMSSQIGVLSGHTIICGYGRIGAMLSQELHAGRARFVVLERSQAKFEEAREHGHLCLHADATDEQALVAAGVGRARVLATVLPDDAANVFITLSARSLNPAVRILARGEAPTTTRKLLQAGASEVVLPAHIGAERMAEMILFPEAARAGGGNAPLRGVETQLRQAGLGLELAIVQEGSAYDGQTVAGIERLAGGGFLIVGIERGGGAVAERAQGATRVDAGDGVLVLGRAGVEAALAGFAAGSGG